MGDARRYAAGALATLASISVTIGLAAPAGAQPSSPSPATPTTPIISTAAGNGTAGFAGDGGSATSAEVNAPTGVAEDTLGNIYIGDTSNNRVRTVTTGGIISTIAGNGQFGFGGDGGQATNAKLAAPTGTAVDGAGDVFIADTDNNRVRKVAPNGIITTYAGTGRCNADGDNGMATNSGICLPTGVALDSSGDLFIADSGNNEVREVMPNGMITRFAGAGGTGSSGDGGQAKKAKLNTPSGVAVDNNLHRVYIADTGNSKVRAVDTTSGIISTFAGNGTFGFGGDGAKAPLAELASPTGLGVDPLGNVYISDTLNNRVRVVIPLGDIFTYAGTGVAGYSGDGGPATAAMINAPTGNVAVDGQNVYISDTNNNRIRRVVGGPPPNIPETPFNVALLPLSAFALLGGGFLIVYRRRRRHGVATA
jgi:sugar lactone lactonase YvrE